MNQVTRRGFVKSSTFALSGLAAESRSQVRSPRGVTAIGMTLEMVGRAKDDIVNRMLQRLEKLSHLNADIYCLPETFATTVREPETVPGPIVSAFARFAAQQHAYVICPLHTVRNGLIYNSAVLIDRSGAVAGQYDKTRPNQFECDSGVTPGALPPPLFDTDFGRIGIQICFDCNWPRDWNHLKREGAEIIFWPSAFPGGRMLQGLAWMNRLYIVTAPYTHPAAIYDISGDPVDESGKYQDSVSARLNLEKELFEVDYNLPKVPRILEKYGEAVKIKYYHHEDWFTLESGSPDLKISDLIKEFDLIPHWDYILRSERYQTRFRDPVK